jgi:hypothetical protein
MRTSLLVTALAAAPLLGCGAATNKSPIPASPSAPKQIEGNNSERAPASGKKASGKKRAPVPSDAEERLGQTWNRTKEVVNRIACVISVINELKKPESVFSTVVQIRLDESRKFLGCDANVFSPTKPPRLQWQAEYKLGQPSKVTAKRPEKFRPPTEGELQQLQALLLAAGEGQDKGLLFPVIIDEHDKWVVYLIAIAKGRDNLALGPHFRLEVARDGKSVLTRKQLSPAEEAELLMANGKRIDAIKLDPVDEDLPNEVHMFMSSFAGVTLLVPTRTGTWVVHKNRVNLVKEPD